MTGTHSRTATARYAHLMDDPLYDSDGQDDDEPGFKFDSHVFKPGEYVSIREHDGRMRTFKVAAVDPLRAASPA